MLDIKSPTVCGGLRIRANATKHNEINKPLVSIVTVVWNAKSLLDRTIESVISQTYDNIEYIVIDGGSSDGTLDVIRQYDNLVDYWMSEPDSGIYDAMNKGIKLCRGELIGIIGAGDWYEPNAVSHVVDTYLRTRADVVYGDVELVDCETGIGCKRESKAEFMPKSMISISHPSTFTKTDIYHTRPFDQSFRIAADYDLFLDLYVSGRRFEHSNSVITHILSGGVSGSYATILEVYKVHRKYFGVAKAFMTFVPSSLRHTFYKSRQWLIRKVLSPENYSAVRARWLHYKSRNIEH